MTLEFTGPLGWLLVALLVLNAYLSFRFMRALQELRELTHEFLVDLRHRIDQAIVFQQIDDALEEVFEDESAHENPPV